MVDKELEDAYAEQQQFIAKRKNIRPLSITILMFAGYGLINIIINIYNYIQ